MIATMNKVGISDAAFAIVATTLLILWVVAMFWGAIRRFHFANLFQVAMMMGVMWVGWTIRTWPTRHKGDGMVLTLLMAWRDSVITLVYLAARLVGFDDVWHWIGRFFT
jgi:hypothetical protein